MLQYQPLDLAFQVAEGRSLDDDAYLDDIAPVTFISVLRKSFGTRAYALGRLALYSDDDHFGPTERAVPGYTLFDLGGGFKVTEPLEIRVQARNLFNEEYYASQDVRTVLAAGRSANVTLAVRF